MEARRQTWLSFSIFGLAAGWIAASYVSSPLIAVTPWRVGGPAALCSAIALGCAGLTLDRSGRSGSHWWFVRVLAAGVFAGSATGWFVAQFHPGTGYGPEMSGALAVGTLVGALAAVLCFPAFALLRGDALRPPVARSGSLAADTDSRRRAYLLIGMTALAALAMLPDWLAHGAGMALYPWEADLVAALLAVGAAAMGLFEVRALRRVAAVESSLTVMKPLSETAREEQHHHIDLGLGQEVHCKTSQATPYRAHEKIEVLVHGSVAPTRQLVRRALRHAVICLAFVGVGAGLGRIAARPTVAFAFLEIACRAGSAWACYDALQMSKLGLVRVDETRAQSVARLWCDYFGAPSSRCVPEAEEPVDVTPLVHSLSPELTDPRKSTQRAPESFQVMFETTKGNFVLQVTRAWAPNGADRFYQLVRIGYFESIALFRVVEDFVVQFGIHGDPRIANLWLNAHIPPDPQTQSNTRGRLTFAMAGGLEAAHTRSVQLFINYGANRPLDALGCAPIGEVVAGMDVVDAFYNGYGERPTAHQSRIAENGNAYLRALYPGLDYINRAFIRADTR